MTLQEQIDQTVSFIRDRGSFNSGIALGIHISEREVLMNRQESQLRELIKTRIKVALLTALKELDEDQESPRPPRADRIEE